MDKKSAAAALALALTLAASPVMAKGNGPGPGDPYKCRGIECEKRGPFGPPSFGPDAQPTENDPDPAPDPAPEPQHDPAPAPQPTPTMIEVVETPMGQLMLLPETGFSFFEWLFGR